MSSTREFAFRLAAGCLLMAVACSGGEDDEPEPATSGGTIGGSGASPATTTEAGASPAATSGGGAASAGSEATGSVTIGDETWKIVATTRCDFEAVANSPLTVIGITGQAEEDESIEIVIEFDPRDTGLVMTVQDDDGDPAWSANNASFVVRAGSSTIGGDGTFDSLRSPGTSEAGKFDMRC